MVRKKLKKLYGKDAREFFNQVMVEQPLLPFLIPLGLFAWLVERWVVPFSNWVPLAAAVWATIQYGRFKRRLTVEDLNKRWKHLILNTTPTTPIEPCEWLKHNFCQKFGPTTCSRNYQGRFNLLLRDV